MFLCPSQFPSGTLVTGAGSKAFGTKRARFISSPPLLRQKLSLPNKRTRSCRSLSPTPHLPDKEHEPPPPPPQTRGLMAEQSQSLLVTCGREALHTSRVTPN